MAKTTPQQQTFCDGFDVGAEQAASAFAGRSHPVFALAPVMVPEDQTLRWHWLSGYSVGFQTALHDAVTISQARPPRRPARPPVLPAQPAQR
jgi:hypothetical protein